MVPPQRVRVRRLRLQRLTDRLGPRRTWRPEKGPRSEVCGSRSFSSRPPRPASRPLVMNSDDLLHDAVDAGTRLGELLTAERERFALVENRRVLGADQDQYRRPQRPAGPEDRHEDKDGEKPAGPE